MQQAARKVSRQCLALDGAIKVLHVATDQQAWDRDLTEAPAEAQLQQLHAKCLTLTTSIATRNADSPCCWRRAPLRWQGVWSRQA